MLHAIGGLGPRGLGGRACVGPLVVGARVLGGRLQNSTGALITSSRALAQAELAALRQLNHCSNNHDQHELNDTINGDT